MRRTLLAARTLYGLGLLFTPGPVLSALERAPLDRRVVVVARVLGARQLVQVALLRRYPMPTCQLAGAGVDAAHAISMLAVTRWSPSPMDRRLARRDARTALVLAATGVGGWVASVSHQ